MSDPFSSYTPSMDGPASKLFPLTPDDANDLGMFVRALSVNSSGLVRVTTVGDTEATIYVAAGAPFPVRVRRVWATGTDATGIVGLV